MLKILSYALVFALGGFLGRAIVSVPETKPQNYEDVKVSETPVKIASEGTSKSLGPGRAPAAANARTASSVLQEMDHLKFAELAAYYERRNKKFYDSTVDAFAPRHIFSKSDNAEELALFNRTTDAIDGAREQSKYWKASGTFVEGEHTVQFFVMLEIQNPRKLPEGAEPESETEEEIVCTYYHRVYVVDGVQINRAMAAGGGSCGASFRFVGQQPYFEDTIYGSLKVLPMSLVLFPTPFGPGGNPYYYSSDKEDWLPFSNFRWETATQADADSFVKDHPDDPPGN